MVTIIAMATGTAMTEALPPAALRRLLTWLSPAYPVGGFSYSHGLEWAIEDGDVTDRVSLARWISELLSNGAGRTDLILLAQAWRAARAQDRSAIASLVDLGIALSISAERRLETVGQGEAFLRATRSAWPHQDLDEVAAFHDGEVAYPIAVGAAAAIHDLPLVASAHAFLTAFAASLISAGVRLIPLGQTDALRATVELDGIVEVLAEDARKLSLDDLGGCSFRADIAAMRHETQHTRLFRS